MHQNGVPVGICAAGTPFLFVSNQNGVNVQRDRLLQQGLTSPPTQYRLYGRRFLQVKRPNQQYQSTEGTHTLHK